MTKNCNKKKRITQSRFTHFFCIGRISVSNHEHIKEVFRWKGVRANFDLTVWLKLVKCRCLFAQESRRLAPRPKKVPHPPTDRICEFIHPPVSQLLIHSRIWNWHLILIDGNLQLEHVSLCTQSFQRYIMNQNVVPCHFCFFFSVKANSAIPLFFVSVGVRFSRRFKPISDWWACSLSSVSLSRGTSSLTTGDCFFWQSAWSFEMYQASDLGLTRWKWKGQSSSPFWKKSKKSTMTGVSC